MHWSTVHLRSHNIRGIPGSIVTPPPPPPRPAPEVGKNRIFQFYTLHSHKQPLKSVHGVNGKRSKSAAVAFIQGHRVARQVVLWELRGPGGRWSARVVRGAQEGVESESEFHALFLSFRRTIHCQLIATRFAGAEGVGVVVRLDAVSSVTQSTMPVGQT